MSHSNFFVAFLAVAIADVPVMPDQFSLLCEGEQATGFNWVNGEWVKANFKPDRYIVVQSLENECWFGVQPDRTLKGDKLVFFREACLSIREIGEEFKPKQSEKFSESYVNNDGKWIRQFSCDGFIHNISGNFDGGFRRVSKSSVTDHLPTKDSMVLEVGRCSRIS